MTIDEAIEHAEHVAASCDGECAEEHRQLAEWLRELVKARHNILILMAEVHTLRDERARYENLAGILEREWGIEVEWDGVRRLWYVGLNDRGVMERDKRETENAELRYKAHILEGGNRELKVLYDSVKANNDRLRELITGVHEALCADRVGIFHRLILAGMEDDMRELGIEVE